MRNTLIIIAFSIFTTGCSGYVDDWPKLNDPLPAASERERIFAVADVKVSPESMIESTNLSLEAHKEAVTSFNFNIEEFHKALDLHQAIIRQSNDPEDKLIAWTSAQLDISRASAKIEKLRELYETPIEPETQESIASKERLKSVILTLDGELRVAKAVFKSLKPQ